MNNFKRYIALFSDTEKQALVFIRALKEELENNERLQDDFPEATGTGKVWQYNQIVTTNDCKVQAWGSTQAIRGALHGTSRPDLCIYDDLENDENVITADQRKKTADWFYRAALNLGDIKYTDHIAVGTIIHHDCLLRHLIDDWRGQIFIAIEQWSTSPLWREWERLYLDDPVGARKFFNRNRIDMLRGTRVLWNAGESYYSLMEHKFRIGIAAFEAEKQNNPIDPGLQFHPEDKLIEHMFEPSEIAGKPLLFHGKVDPSLGDTKNLPSAIIIVAKTPTAPTIYKIVDDIQHRAPYQLVKDILRYQQKYRCQFWSVETVGNQRYLLDMLLKEGQAAGVAVPAIEYQPQGNKDLRIQRLQPYYLNGVIRLPREDLRRRNDPLSLFCQLIQYPKGKYIDGPDAMEMDFERFLYSGTQEYVSVEKRKSTRETWGRVF